MENIILLLNQFNKAKGYTESDLKSKQYTEEFVGWLRDLKKQSKQYSDFTLSNGIDLSDFDMIEINKGILDTITGSGIMISPFGPTLNQIKQDLLVYQGEPFIVSGSKIIRGQVVDTYCTHNPYNYHYYGNIHEIHNNGYKICLGVFGKNADNDKDAKIRSMVDISEKMADDYRKDYCTVGDNYYCMIYTKRKVLTKINSFFD